MPILPIALSTIHVLAAAAWFGAMLYSLTVLHPRAALFFENDADFEAFVTTVSAGARWKVLAACILIAVSGIALTMMNWRPPALSFWLVILGLKLALFLIAVGLFSYTSWRLWPARIFATGDEIAKFQREFRIIGWFLLALVGFSMALGVASHML